MVESLQKLHKKAMTKTDLPDSPCREPGAVEARQGDGRNPITSELGLQTHVSVGVFVQATSVPRACWSLKEVRFFAAQFEWYREDCILTAPVSRI